MHPDDAASIFEASCSTLYKLWEEFQEKGPAAFTEQSCDRLLHLRQRQKPINEDRGSHLSLLQAEVLTRLVSGSLPV